MRCVEAQDDSIGLGELNDASALDLDEWGSSNGRGNLCNGDGGIHTFALLIYSFSNGVAGCSRLSSTSVNGDAPSR